MPLITSTQTSRLLLRSWRPEDASELLPILESNWEHLSPWIPARVAQPSPLPELSDRLAGFAAAFLADREWRFAMIASDNGRVLGEASLFPRTARARVHLAEADRVEVGYWIRRDATGGGLVTEAVRALLSAAANEPRFQLAEIRCDARNLASAAIPQRLGFALDETVSDPERASPEDAYLQVWSAPLAMWRTGKK